MTGIPKPKCSGVMTVTPPQAKTEDAPAEETRPATNTEEKD